MTKAQIKKAESMIGKMPVNEMAAKLSVSVSNLKRAFRGRSIWYKNGKYKNQPELVKKVISYYEQHGKPATVKKFPAINVKALVDRPEYYGIPRVYRQIRWTEEQVAQLARFGGLISYSDQAKFFSRPGAFEGSIKSAWMKKFGVAGGCINGMSHHKARHFVTKRCPIIRTKFWETRQKRESGDVEYARIIYLWVDMEKHLRSDCPEFIAEAIRSMAEFQRWLFKTKYVRRKILKMISEVSP